MSLISGERLVLEQDDDTLVELVVWGDEFYVRYETPSGYTAVKDPESGLFCYATLTDGRFVSTGATIDKRPPSGLRRHLKEAPEIRRARFQARYDQLRPREPVAEHDGRVLTFGPNNGLLSGRRVSQGNVVGLTVMVEFSDVKAAVTADEVSELLNGENYSANGNFCSVREYYDLMSSGKLNFRNLVVGPIELPNTRKHYETTLLVPEAFELAMEQLDRDGVDLNQLDSLGTRHIDALSFMYAGGTVYGINGDNRNPSNLWPHNSVINLSHGNLRTHFYMISSMGRRAVDLSIGTYCHEAGHQLCRFPDLYDYGSRDGDVQRSSGLGRYCLMSSGNHLNNGRTPAPICAYLRDLVGWTDDEVLLTGSRRIEAQHGNYGQVLKYPTENDNEYFLVENRSQQGLDAFLPSSGLAVYLCDTMGSNEYQGGTEFRHYQCALLQADGRRDLERNRGSDNEDLFGAIPGVALSHETAPSSLQWDGSDSGLVISEISDPGNVISFQVGETGFEQERVVTVEKVAHLLIPDDDPAGVKSSLEIETPGKLEYVRVEVDITHSYISDMKVALIAPGGTRVLLHDKQGGSADDLRVTYDQSNTNFDEMVGKDITGTWSLEIQDHAAQDVGRLNRWNLSIGYESSEQTVQGEARPDLAIPDNQPAGVSSDITIAAHGALVAANVEVSISHTYIGDLMVELVAPSGRSAVLHNRTGQSRNNLRRNYDHISAPALDVLVGEDVNGVWQLRVRDLERRDIGKFDKWSLILRHTT